MHVSAPVQAPGLRSRARGRLRGPPRTRTAGPPHLRARLGALLLGSDVGGDVRVGGVRVAAHLLLQPRPVRDLALCSRIRAESVPRPQPLGPKTPVALAAALDIMRERCVLMVSAGHAERAPGGRSAARKGGPRRRRRGGAAWRAAVRGRRLVPGAGDRAAGAGLTAGFASAHSLTLPCCACAATRVGNSLVALLFVGITCTALAQCKGRCLARHKWAKMAKELLRAAAWKAAWVALCLRSCARAAVQVQKVCVWPSNLSTGKLVNPPTAS